MRATAAVAAASGCRRTESAADDAAACTHTPLLRSYTTAAASVRRTMLACSALLFLLLALPCCCLASLPAPLAATWIKRSVLPDAQFGSPNPRCDHSFASLSQRGQRRNAAFPNLAVPAVDEFDGAYLVYGGHQDADYNDTWLLLPSAAPHAPMQWKLLPASPLGDEPLARYGCGMAFVPAEPVTGAAGLTALIYAGYSSSSYMGDVSSFHLASGTWRTVVPEKLVASDTQPFARGYLDWNQLPLGAGTDSIDSSADSGLFETFSGLGPSDGVRYSVNDHAWTDEWRFNLSSVQWHKADSTECLASTVNCIDAVEFAEYLQSIAAAGVFLNLTTPLRPSSRVAAMARVVSTIQNRNLVQGDPDTLDDPAACTESCSLYAEIPDRVQPQRAEGLRAVVLGSFEYSFGGYTCSTYGQQQSGGDDCYFNDMRILDLKNFTWRIISPPPDGDEWAPYWPSRRAYHSMVAVPERGLVIVEGGAYQESSGTFYFMNDVYAFDVALGRFVPLSIGGIPPPIHWSSGLASRHGSDDVMYYGGCQGARYYDSVYTLTLGLKVVAENAYAFGEGLSTAQAGVPQSFRIQTREFVRLRNATANDTGLVWGANAVYGTGLTFSAQLVSSSTPSGALALVQAKAVELGDGAYEFTYTATAGREFKVFLSLEDRPIPGSPFTMLLAPSPNLSESRTSADGFGRNLTAKGTDAEVRLALKDEFGNGFIDDRFLAPAERHSGERVSDGSVPVVFQGVDGRLEFTATRDTLSLALGVRNNADGSLTLRYAVPTSTADYSLSLRLNGVDVDGSPFAVSALDPIVQSRAAVLAFLVLAAIAIAVCLASSALVFYYRQEPVIRSSSPNFLYLLIVGSVMSSLSVVFLTLPDHDYACQSFHSLLSIGLVTSMAALLAKSARVARIFNATKLKVQTNLGDAKLFLPTGLVIFAMLLLNLMWIGINPMHSVSSPSNNPAYAAVLSFRSCSSANGNAWLGTMISFCALMLLYGVYLVFQTGHVPEQFNEAKLITATVYNIFFCAVVVVPLLFFLGNTSEFISGRLVIQALVILWCSLFNVVALIAPKLRVIWMLPKGSVGYAATVVDENRSHRSHLDHHARRASTQMPGAVKSPGVSGLPTPTTRHSAAAGVHMKRSSYDRAIQSTDEIVGLPPKRNVRLSMVVPIASNSSGVASRNGSHQGSRRGSGARAPSSDDVHPIGQPLHSAAHVRSSSASVLTPQPFQTISMTDEAATATSPPVVRISSPNGGRAPQAWSESS